MEFEGVFEAIHKNEVRVKILEKRKNLAEPQQKVILYQALPKKRELFEWVLQKCTEIGVSEFVPLITKRTERENPGAPERLERILKEAAEQSERGKIPLLQPAQTLSKIMEAKLAAGTHFLFHSRGTNPSLATFLKNTRLQEPAHLYIGPEGGFTEEEAKQAEKAGATLLALGPRILRTETAAVAASAFILLQALDTSLP